MRVAKTINENTALIIKFKCKFMNCFYNNAKS